MTTHGSPAVDVHVLFRRGDLILLSHRGGDFGYGQWCLPAGKLEPDEPLVMGAIREMKEETGVAITRGDLRLVHVVDAHRGQGHPNRIGFFFEARQWTGEPENLEPHKCLALEWFDVHKLPPNILPYSAAGLRGALEDPAGLSLFGWDSVIPPAGHSSQ